MSQLVALGEYEGVSIQARPSDEYINATEMCKATGKEWSNYWKNQQTKDFVGALSAALRIRRTELILSLQGGDPRLQGTWVHRRIAIHLAQWCSPQFAVWVSGRIEEVLTTGRSIRSLEHLEADEIHYQIGLLASGQRLTHSELKKRTPHEQSRKIAQDEIAWDHEKTRREKKPNRHEAAIRDQLQKEIGGQCEVNAGVSGRIDLLTDDEIIEVKEETKWKQCIGQLTEYSKYYHGHLKRAHLFVRPGTHAYSYEAREKIHRAMANVGIRVTWHPFDVPRPVKNSQRYLWG